AIVTISPSRFIALSPLPGFRSRDDHFEPDGFDNRSLQLVGIGGVPLVEPFTHAVEGMAPQSLGDARNKTLGLGRRICGVIRGLDLNDVGDTDEISLLQLFRRL